MKSKLELSNAVKEILKPPGSLLANDRSKAVVLVYRPFSVYKNRRFADFLVCYW